MVSERWFSTSFIVLSLFTVASNAPVIWSSLKLPLRQREPDVFGRPKPTLRKILHSRYFDYQQPIKRNFKS